MVFVSLISPPRSAAADDWGFRFNRSSGIAAAGGLSVSFSRSVETIDPRGTVAAQGDPRWDYNVYLPSVPAPAAVMRVTTDSRPRVLASGMGADGTTEYMVYIKLGVDFSDLTVFTGGSTTVAFTTPLIVKGSVLCIDSTSLGLPNDHWFHPEAAVVFNGAIFLAGPIHGPNGMGGHQTAGWGFLINRNLSSGTSWTVLWTDLNDNPQDLPKPRGREWVLKAAPVFQRGVTNPTEFWLCCADYRHQSVTNPPQGGRIYAARLKRSTASSSDWDIDATNKKFVYFDLPQGSNLPSGATGCHAHACHMLEHGSEGVQLIAAVGDFYYHNRFVRFVLEDRTADFTNRSLWTPTSDGDSDYHGLRNASAKQGTWSCQPVGVAWGSYIQGGGTISGSLIWGVDEDSEWFMKVVPPGPGAGVDQLQFTHLYGYATGFGSSLLDYLGRHRALAFTIAERRPQKQEPLVAVLSDGSGDPRINRVLYCANSAFPDRWIQAASFWSSGNPGTAVYYGGKIWYTAWEGSAPGLYSIPVPDTAVRGPIVVGPGGTNLVHEDWLVEQGGQETGSLDELSLNDPAVPGVFKDGTKILPAVPTYATKAYKITTSTAQAGGSNNKFIATIHPSSAGSGWNLTSPSWATSLAQIRRIRAWVLDDTYDQAALANNKTTQLSTQIINVTESPQPNGDIDPTKVRGAPTKNSCPDKWCPATVIGYRTIDTPTFDGPGLRLRSAFNSLATTDDNSFYFVLDSALDGRGSLPYPIKHAPTGTGIGQSGPDEQLTVSVVSGGPSLAVNTTAQWSLRLGGMVPRANWDQYADRSPAQVNLPKLDERYWPLFCLWADDNDYLEFQANCTSRAFRAIAVRNGTPTTFDFGGTDQFWLPDSPLFVALGYHYDSADGKGYLAIGASLGGGPVQMITSPNSKGIDVGSWLGTATFTQLRFRAGPSTAITGRPANEVSEFRWFGGRFHDDAPALDNTTLPGAVSDLDWLTDPL